MTDILTIGRRIALLRKNAGLSQQQLAEKLDVSRSLVGQIEKDLTKPNLEFLTGFVHLVNTKYELLLDSEISEDELLSFEGEKGHFIKGIDEVIFNTVLDIAWDKIQDKSIPDLGQVLVKRFKEVDVINRILLRREISEDQIEKLLKVHLDRFLAYKGIKPSPSHNSRDQKK